MAKRPWEISQLLVAGVAAGALALVAGSASAQFGQIFGGPPRPPANVPGPSAAPPSSAPLGLPEQMPPEEMDEESQPSPPARMPPAGMVRPQPGVAVAPGSAVPGAVRSQPLAPPPGVAVAPPGSPATPPAGAPGQSISGQPPAQAAVPPGQRPSGSGGPQPASPQDEVVTEMPSQKIANPTAVFAGLDKITGRIIAFDVALNEKVQFGALQVTPRVCYTRPPTEQANTDAFVEVDEVTLQGEVKRLFTGWMFAASPGINAVEHPIYDVWLTDCKGGAATVVSDAQAQPAPPPASAAAPRRPSQPQPRNAPPAPPAFRR